MLVFEHETFADHRPPAGHPERPARLQAARAGLETALGAFESRAPGPADDDTLALLHPARHFKRVEEAIDDAAMSGEPAALDADTWVTQLSMEAALRAVGAGVEAVDAVLAGDDATAFCLVRPPGHHAEPTRAMGFCLFSNIAIAAAHAQYVRGLERVAILDFDVHHGNGTEACIGGQSGVFFASTHEFPLFPGTGGDTALNTKALINIPLPPGFTGAVFRASWEEGVFPLLDAYDPELILVSAGFDAHARDPLSSAQLQADDFAWIGAAIREAAQGGAKGRVVAMLEGGYDLEGLRDGVAAFAGALAKA